MITFEQIIEDKKILRAVEEMGYTEPTEIQQKAIPSVLAGKDIIAKSNTGTGKTASFGLPVLQKLHANEMDLVLIVCPTRELVLQVTDEIQKYSKYLEGIKTVSVFGGTPIDRQIRSLKKGAKIVVGTPGRLLDHIRRKTIRLKNCDCVVLDEADEMLNMGFRDDIEEILSKVEKEHQTILFSATMPKEIRDIAKRYLKDQIEIEVKSKQKTVDKIDQYYYEIGRGKKNLSVKSIIDYYDVNLCIIFCNTKAKVDELVEVLNKNGVKSVGLHGDIRQDKRTRIMEQFKKSKKAILVASDVAARGIDVNNIDVVINYDLPQDNEIYVHRIGRTGRAGKQGMAITLVQGNKQMNQLKGIMRFTKADIKRKELPTGAEIQDGKRKAFKEKVLTKAQEGLVQENIQLANELVKEGLDPQEIISALISIAYGGSVATSSTAPKKVRKLKKGVELKFTVGKAMKVTSSDIENAIIGTCNLKVEDIGTIDVRRQYSIVIVSEKNADQVIESMNRSQIKNKPCDVYYYKKEKSER